MSRPSINPDLLFKSLNKCVNHLKLQGCESVVIICTGCPAEDHADTVRVSGVYGNRFAVVGSVAQWLDDMEDPGETEDDDS